MAPLIIYLLKVNVVVSILFTAYFILLRYEKFFGLNRLFLLGTLIISFVIAQTQLSGNIVYCEHDMELSPFSFFHYLIINKSQCVSGQFRQIVEHEKVHIRQWHTLDMLFAELVHIFLWINPLFPAIKRHIKLNLEYIADKNVLETGIDKKSYQLSLLSCLKPAAIPLTNLFNSSKIKLRIKMMNLKKSPARNLCKYAVVLPLFLVVYFVINPLTAKSFLEPALKKGDSRFVPQHLEAFEGTYRFQKNKRAYIQITAHEDHLVLKQLWDYKPAVIKEIQLTQQQLKAFEGVYQFQNNKEAFIQISAHGNNLILKQLWDGVEMSFTPTSALEFYCKEKSFPLKFYKNKDGAITQVLALDKDLWDKVKDYKPVVKKEIQLTPEQLKAVEGKYQFQFKKGKDDFIQITAKENGVVLKQFWDGKEISFVPSSEVDFFCKEQPFPLKFYKDKNGTVTQVLAFNRDLWNRVQE